jgi:hypothetical protein
MTKRSQTRERPSVRAKTKARDQTRNTAPWNGSTDATSGQASARLVRLLHGAGLLNEQVLRRRLGEHFRGNPSPKAEMERVLLEFRRMLEATPCNAASVARTTGSPARPETMPVPQASLDKGPSKSPIIDPDFMRRVVHCWLDTVEERAETIMTELTRIENLLDMIEANAQRLPPKEVGNLRVQAQELFDKHFGDLGVLSQQVSKITAAIDLRPGGADAAGPAL